MREREIEENRRTIRKSATKRKQKKNKYMKDHGKERKVKQKQRVPVQVDCAERPAVGQKFEISQVKAAD